MDISARRQLVSNNSVKCWEWIFSADTTLYTTEMPDMEKHGFDLGYKYESCVFREDGSDVLDRYDTIEEARRGHQRLTEELGLRFIDEYFIPDVGKRTIL